MSEGYLKSIDRAERITMAAAPRVKRDLVCTLQTRLISSYDIMMIRIRFTSDNDKRRALGFLLGRYSFKSFATGEMLLPDYALPALAREGISFTVEEPATYEQIIAAIRTPSS
jgi:hypothetical protein